MKSKLVSVGMLLLIPYLWPTAAHGAGIALDFNLPVHGTIQDATGQGTGFTHRLPLSGGDLLENDRNLDLSNGVLAITATKTHLHLSEGSAPRTLGIVEAPGVYLENVGSSDLTVTAVFKNVQLDTWSDQLQVYAGASTDSNVRAGLHMGKTGIQYILSNNQGSDVGWGENPFTSDEGMVTCGDDVTISLLRRNGFWFMSWNNLSKNQSDNSPSYTASWLDNIDDLYFGVYYANPRDSDSSFTTTDLDTFSVGSVPEPTSLVLLSGLGMMALIGARRRKQVA